VAAAVAARRRRLEGRARLGLGLASVADGLAALRDVSAEDKEAE